MATQAPPPPEMAPPMAPPPPPPPGAGPAGGANKKPTDLTSLPAQNVIPGIGLMSDPSAPKPWERPPEYTTYQEAAGYICSKMLEPHNFTIICDMLRSGIPVETLTEITAKMGVFQGKYNTDMMLLMLEPIMILIVNIANKVGIDYIFEEDEDGIDDADIELMMNKIRKKDIVSKDAMVKDMAKKVESDETRNVSNTAEKKLSSLLGGNINKRIDEAQQAANMPNAGGE
jgi:hypothetical protein